MRSAALLVAIAAAQAGCAPKPYVPVADPAHVERYAETGRFSLGHPRAISVTGDDVLFLRSGPTSYRGDLYELNTKTGKERVLLTAQSVLKGADEHLSAEERARRERKRQVATGIAKYQLSKDGARILVPLSGRLYVVDRQTSKTVELVGKAKGTPFDARLSPDAQKAAFVRDGDVFVVDVPGGGETRITTREGDQVWGTAEFVAEEEMGRYAGYWWSPDSRSLLVQRTDNKDVERLWIHNPAKPEKAPSDSPYPRAGTPNAQVDLFLFPAIGGPSVPVKWDTQTYPYLVSVKWVEGAPLTLVVQNRRQTEIVLLTADATTGETTRLHSERDDAWVNIDQDVPRWLPDGRFLWTSERNGALRLELRARDGSHVRTLTSIEFGYRSLVHVDAAGTFAVVRACPTPLETQLYRIALDKEAGPQRLTTAPGTHAAKWGAKIWVDAHISVDGVRKTTAHKLDGSDAGTLTSLAAAPPFVPSVEFTTVEAGRKMHAALVRPRNFEPDRRYPVIVYVYGGPHYQVVTANKLRYYVQQFIADHGFILVNIDGRGTPRRGRAWERSIKNDVISGPMEDQVAGLKALGERYSELDLTRVGIYGWSFGGYFTSMAVMRRPDVYHAGFSGAPVADWHDYDTHYTERYMGLPEENPKGYKDTSLLHWAKKLTRPLLIAHGTVDDNVYLVNTIKLSDALFRAGKAHAILPLSGFTHMVHGKLPTRRLYSRIAEFFVKELRP